MSNKTPTRQWVQTFFKYIAAPRDELEKFYASRSRLAVNHKAPLLSASAPEPYNYPALYSDSETDFKRDFLKFNSSKTIASFAAGKIHHTEFINGNIVYFQTYSVVFKGSSKSFDFNCFKVVFNVANFKNLKHRYFFNDSNTKTTFQEVKIMKKTRLNYLTCLIKMNNNWHFVRFNDFADVPYSETLELFALQKSFILTNPWIDRIRLIDINESLNAKNIYDVAVYTKDNLFWYGQLDLSSAKKLDDWKKDGFIKLGKVASSLATTNYNLSNVKGILVNSMIHKINNKETFFGNIVVSTTAGSAGSQLENRDPINLNVVLPEVDLDNRDFYELQPFTGNDSVDRFLGDRKLNSLTSAEILKYYSKTINYWQLQKFKEVLNNQGKFTSINIVSKKIKISFLGPRIDSIGFSDARPLYVLEIDINTDILKSISSSPKLTYGIEFLDTRGAEMRVSVYLDGKLIGSTNMSSFRNLKTHQGYPLFGFIPKVELAFNMSYRENLAASTSGKLFQISIREYEKNYNKLIFEVDKVIEDVQDSKKGLALSNNEIYVPVKIDNNWQVYLFDMNVKITEDDNLLIPSAPLRVQTIGQTTAEIYFVKIEEKAHSTPILGIIFDDKVQLFYKILDKSVSPNDYLGSRFTLNGGRSTNFDLMPLVWREQNICKFIFNNFTYSVRFNGEAFSLNNLPYLFNSQSEYNTVSENFKPAMMEGKNKAFNATVNNIIQNNNTIITSSILEKNTLRDMANIDSFDLLDNAGNIITTYGADGKDSVIDKGANEVINLNASMTFNWYDGGIYNAENSTNFASIFTNPKMIDKFRIRHIRYRVNRENGKKYYDYMQINDWEDLDIVGNTLLLSVGIVYRSDEGDTEKVYLDEFYQGDYLINEWRKMPIGIVDVSTTTAFVYNTELTWNEEN